MNSSPNLEATLVIYTDDSTDEDKTAVACASGKHITKDHLLINMSIFLAEISAMDPSLNIIETKRFLK